MADSSGCLPEDQWTILKHQMKDSSRQLDPFEYLIYKLCLNTFCITVWVLDILTENPGGCNLNSIN